MRSHAPRYPALLGLAARLSGTVMVGHRRSFCADAQAAVRQLNPPLQVLGEENIPQTGPCLVTINHFTRPGFRAWWLTLAVSAVIPVEIRWVITAAWTFPDGLRARTVTPMTYGLFPRIAEVYGFISMPPMPPRPQEAQRRADAVRHCLTCARQDKFCMIGLAPEGGDSAGGILSLPPPGVGRFMLHLAAIGLQIAPVGIYEEDGRLCLRFGQRYRLELAAGLPAVERDRCASQIVMSNISRLLPAALQGEFST